MVLPSYWKVPLVAHFDHVHLGPVRRNVRSAARARVGADVLHHPLSNPRRVQLGHPLLGGTDEGVDPVGHGIEPVVLGQLEHRGAGHGAGLGVHRSPLGTGPFQEGELLPVAGRSVLVIADRSPLEGPACRQAHLDEEVLPPLARGIPFHSIHQKGRHPGNGGHRRTRVASSDQIRLTGRQGSLGRPSGPADAAHTELGQHVRQGQELLVGCHLAGDKAAVVGTVRQGLH